jgi:hypothetical protein
MTTYFIDRFGVVSTDRALSVEKRNTLRESVGGCCKDRVALRHEAYLKERARHRRLALKGLAR